MPVNFTPYTKDDARKVSTRTLLKAGWCDVARILEAVQKVAAKSGKPMFELTVSVPDAEGDRELRDWIVPASKFHALKFFHCCEAVGAMAQYEAGSIAAEDFVATNDFVRVKIGIRKQRGYPDSNIIEDYAPAKSSVVTLHRSAG